MTPRMEQVAFGMAGALAERVLPHLMNTSYPLGTAGATAALLVFMAQDMDRGAQRRMDEITGMKRLFAEAASLKLAPELAEHVAAAAARPPPASLSLGALDGERAVLLGPLVALHAAVEELPGDDARAMERAILVHLRKTADARALVIPPAG